MFDEHSFSVSFLLMPLRLEIKQSMKEHKQKLRNWKKSLQQPLDLRKNRLIKFNDLFVVILHYNK